MPELEIHTMHVGRGSANLIITPEDETILVDIEGGSLGKDVEKSVSDYIKKYLRNVNPTSPNIDYLILSHRHEDHCGNTDIMSFLNPSAVFFPPQSAIPEYVPENSVGETIERIARKEITEVILSRETSSPGIFSSEIDFNIVSPPRIPGKKINRNDNSLSFVISYGDFSYLYTGDIEHQGDSWILESSAAKDIDCLVAPHHGSNVGHRRRLFNYTSPETVLISSAHDKHDGRYNHPTKDFLDEVARINADAYWTAVHGNIVTVSNGSGYTVNKQSNHSSKPKDLYPNKLPPSEVCDFNPRI